MSESNIRKTIYIPEELQKKLAQESIVAGVSQTELIRRAIASYLEFLETGKRPDDRIREVAGCLDDEKDEQRKQRKRVLDSFIGIFDDDDLPEDLSENHDKYLYGGEG
jgi:hypothetical protein